MKYVFIGLTALTIIWAIPMLVVFARMRQARNWPSVTGTVTRSDCKPYIPAYQQNRPANENPTDKYIHDLAYSYEVDDKSFSGELSGLIPARPAAKETTEALAAVYRKGSEVTVFYNPQNPSQAVLDTSFDFPLFRKFVVFVAILLAVGAAGLKNTL